MNINHEKLLKYLESYPNGKMIQSFGSNQPTLDEIAEAKRFAEGMRKNIGDSGIATVEVSYNRVIVQVAESAILHK
jgi:hypothetical protein